MTTPLVGVIGASGAVGSEVTRLLARSRQVRLRIGCRRVDRLRAFAADTPHAAIDVAAVDVDDPDSLAAFCRGCRIVVNCAGPSFRILDVVARAAFEAGAEYVDPGGDRPVHERLSRTPPPQDRIAILTAGLMPGLSGLLPRWLARRGFDRVRQLTAYVGGRGRLTEGTAGDYVLSLQHGDSEALAAWRQGARVSRALEPLVDVELPFFPGRVMAQPFLSAETETLARDLGLADVTWYNVFQGGHMLAALRRLRPVRSPHDLASAVADLTQAADLDLFGEESYQRLVVTLDGEAAGGPVRRTATLHARDAQALTGTIATLATLAIVEGSITPGVWFAADVLPTTVVDRLGDMPAVAAFHVLDDTVIADATAQSAALDEGVL